VRNSFIKKLTQLAKADERIVLLTADLGFSVLEEFAEQFPDRFYNVGVSEQNMIGIATGLAEAGFIPFTYSIAPFSLLRPYEFIKNGPVLHNLPIRIVAIGPGFDYGNLGTTHHLIEDIAVTRVFPNLSTYSPINSSNAGTILEDSYKENNPIYYRIGKNLTSLTDDLAVEETSNIIKLAESDSSICVIGIGSITEELIKSKNSLDNKDDASFYAIKKIDNKLSEELIAIIQNYKIVITVEAHYVNGGIGSILAEVIAENQLSAKLYRLGVRELSNGVFGDTDFMYKKHKISSNNITNLINSIK